MRSTVCSYSHQGYDPRVNQTGRKYTSDFRNPEIISVANHNRSMH
jgi:hypothetical protein